MPALADALAAGQFARLRAGMATVDVHQDITGEHSVTLRYGMGPTRLMGRYPTFPEVEAYLATGAIPGVTGDETTWEPMPS